MNFNEILELTVFLIVVAISIFLAVAINLYNEHIENQKKEEDFFNSKEVKKINEAIKLYITFKKLDKIYSDMSIEEIEKSFGLDKDKEKK